MWICSARAHVCVCVHVCVLIFPYFSSSVLGYVHFNTKTSTNAHLCLSLLPRPHVSHTAGAPDWLLMPLLPPPHPSPLVCLLFFKTGRQARGWVNVCVWGVKGWLQNLVPRPRVLVWGSPPLLWGFSPQACVPFVLSPGRLCACSVHV